MKSQKHYKLHFLSNYLVRAKPNDRTQRSWVFTEHKVWWNSFIQSGSQDTLRRRGWADWQSCSSANPSIRVLGSAALVTSQDIITTFPGCSYIYSWNIYCCKYFCYDLFLYLKLPSLAWRIRRDLHTCYAQTGTFSQYDLLSLSDIRQRIMWRFSCCSCCPDKLTLWGIAGKWRDRCDA